VRLFSSKAIELGKILVIAWHQGFSLFFFCTTMDEKSYFWDLSGGAVKI
jgi:hypothetical protein